MARAATALLDQVDPSPGVRLFGVSVSNLVESGAVQLSLEGEGDWHAATAAVDEVRRRFGKDAVGPASLVREDGLAVKRRGDQQWGPETR